MVDHSTPLIQVNRDREVEEIDWLRMFVRVDTATVLIARKFGARNGNRNVSTFKMCWMCFLAVWWTVTFCVAIALIALGSRDCPGLDELPSAMFIYGSFLLYGPVAFFSEHLAVLIGKKCKNDDDELDEWKINVGLFTWFLLKAAVFVTMFIWTILDGQKLFGFYDKYTTCPDPIPTPDSFPDPDSCQCDPGMFWFAFSTLITMYPVFLFSSLYFVLVYVMLFYLYCTKNN